MPKIRYSSGSIRDLKRIHDFLEKAGPGVINRSALAIRRGLAGLAEYPQIGRTIEELPIAFREWPIAFGDSGYLVRYKFEDNEVLVLSVRHQKEAGFI